MKISEVTKDVGLLYKLQTILPCRSLLIIYESFMRPPLVYVDVFYDKPSNELFSNKNESIQCNVALAVIRAIKNSSRDKSSKNGTSPKKKDEAILLALPNLSTKQQSHNIPTLSMYFCEELNISKIIFLYYLQITKINAYGS